MKNTHIPAPLAALVAVTPKEWLLPPLEVAIQRIVALNPEGDGALYVDGEAPAPSPVKSRDALHLWFDRMPWAVIDIDEREEAMRHIAAEEPGLFLGSLNTRETARFLMRPATNLNTARNRSGDHPEGYLYESQRYRWGRLVGLRWTYQHLKARRPKNVAAPDLLAAE